MTLKALLLFISAAGAHAALVGPLPYKSFSDSPFQSVAFSWFYLEDFEDHLFNVPGASANVGGVTSVVFGPRIHDSVDGDDGAIDGSGLNGDSYFSSSGANGIQFAFDAALLGRLPTYVGIVWTDGSGTITFRAFDSSGQILGAIGPFNQLNVVPDASVAGTTNEDRFFGIVDPAGIAKIFIRNTAGGIEIDHLQYGTTAAAVPDPGALGLVFSGLAGILAMRRARRQC